MGDALGDALADGRICAGLLNLLLTRRPRAEKPIQKGRQMHAKMGYQITAFLY